MKITVISILATCILVGCASPVAKRVPNSAINPKNGEKSIYLTNCDSIPRETIEKVAPIIVQNLRMSNTNLMSLDPAIIAALVQAAVDTATKFSDNNKDIRRGCVTRSTEWLIKGYDQLTGSNIVDIVKQFKEQSGEVFPTPYNK